MAESSVSVEISISRYYFVVKMLFWASVMCQEEISESLELIYFLVVWSIVVKTFQKDLIHCVNCEGHQSFLEPDEYWWNLTGSVLKPTRELSMQYSLWYWNILSEWGWRATNQLGPWKGLKLTMEMPKLTCTVEMPKIWQISPPS